MQTIKNFNDMAADKRWVNTMGVLDGVRQDLKKLAPRPDQKGQDNAPSGNTSRDALLDNHDGMLGGFILEGIFGACFGTAIGDALNMTDSMGAFNWGNTIDLYDEYNRGTEKNRTNGEYELGEHGAIRSGFNASSRPKTFKTVEGMEWDAYLRDLPARRVLEQSMRGLNHQMDQLESMQFRKLKGMGSGMALAI